MKHQSPAPLNFVSRWAGVVVNLVLAASNLEAQETNSPNLAAPVSSFRIPDLDDVTVKGVRVSPAFFNPADVGGQGLVSFDAPASTFSANEPLPSGGTASNKSEFVAAPIPFFSPTFGFGLALGAAYIYNPPVAGTNSQPWITGVGGFYSQNGSWGAAATHKMNWGEDRWRFFGALAYADLKYKFYGIGTGAGQLGQSIPLRQTVAGGVIELLRGVGNYWYVGGRLLYGHVNTSINASSLNVPPELAALPLEFDSQLSALGLRVQRDTRDSSFYPTRGILLDLEANFFDAALGSDFTFQTCAVAYNQYIELATNQVLAVRGYGRATGGSAPFFALSSFGMGADLRGYTPGRYRDQLMFAVQAEYRWRFTERFGWVAFGGVGSVAPEIGQFDTLLPSVGTGLRYVIAKKNNVSMRFDAAWGRDEHTFYFGIGEAF